MNNNYRTNFYWNTWEHDNFKLIPWKLHIYADNLLDYWKIKQAVIPTLQEKEIGHKFVNDFVITEQANPKHNSTKQKGKAITIYPPNKEMFKWLVEWLDHAFDQEGLLLDGATIQGDKAIGKSGRVFYRYEFKSGKHKDRVLDMQNPDHFAFYERNYEANRGDENHLAEDMTEADDLAFELWQNLSTYHEKII